MSEDDEKKLYLVRTPPYCMSKEALARFKEYMTKTKMTKSQQQQVRFAKKKRISQFRNDNPLYMFLEVLDKSQQQQVRFAKKKRISQFRNDNPLYKFLETKRLDTRDRFNEHYLKGFSLRQ